MSTINRIKEAVKAGVKIKSIADKSEVSYSKIASAVNPAKYKYKGDPKFDRFELARINEALDAISAAFSAQ